EHNMACELIERFGTSAQQGRYLTRLASGELLAAFGLTEPGAGSNASALKTHASRRGDNFILNGEKCYITSAGWAGVYLVFARTLEGSAGKDGISAFLVDDDCSGLSISPAEKKMGAELSPIASLTFNEAQVPAGQLLGELHKGYQIALSGLARGRIGIAAIANGIASAAIKLAMKHLSERMQFEQRLIEFQGLQFMLADMQTSLEAAQLLTWQAAHTLESFPKSPLNRRYPSHAKLFATDSAMRITTDAVQLLGGAGYIKEYGAEKLMRDAKMLQIVEGTNQIQRLVIARELEKELL
ncbi:MAG: acyl-CoA dehydrogenase family protein, partial [Bdellovibrionales bacterium]|nr:acyl-CoA dehydrogenase family protein [Bdellovibrionales bacterium]